MKRIAAPMIGGMVTATIFGLIVIPVLYMVLKSRELDERFPNIGKSNPTLAEKGKD